MPAFTLQALVQLWSRSDHRYSTLAKQDSAVGKGGDGIVEGGGFKTVGVEDGKGEGQGGGEGGGEGIPLKGGVSGGGEGD